MGRGVETIGRGALTVDVRGAEDMLLERNELEEGELEELRDMLDELEEREELEEELP